MLPMRAPRSRPLLAPSMSIYCADSRDDLGALPPTYLSNSVMDQSRSNPLGTSRGDCMSACRRGAFEILGVVQRFGYLGMPTDTSSAVALSGKLCLHAAHRPSRSIGDYGFERSISRRRSFLS